MAEYFSGDSTCIGMRVWPGCIVQSACSLITMGIIGMGNVVVTDLPTVHSRGWAAGILQLRDAKAIAGVWGGKIAVLLFAVGTMA